MSYIRPCCGAKKRLLFFHAVRFDFFTVFRTRVNNSLNAQCDFLNHALYLGEPYVTVSRRHQSHRWPERQTR